MLWQKWPGSNESAAAAKSGMQNADLCFQIQMAGSRRPQPCHLGNRKPR
jgi:hypothetical protein